MTMKKAFTLIEILVAIGLVMILTGAGIGTLRQSARRKAVEAAAEDIAAVLHQAQTYAASGNKINCTQGYPLTGWQVEFTASDYKLQEVCPGSGGTPYTIKSGQFLDNITPSTLPSPNPILFRVLNQGTNIVGSTGIVISGFGITKAIGVTSTGEVNLSYTPGAGPTPPAPPTSCNQVTRCSSTANGYQVSYVPVNPPACNQPPGSVNSVVKSCCTTVLGAAGLDCASQSYVTIWNQVFAGATVKLGDARGYKSLRVRFTAPRSGSLGYCTGYYCTFYTTVNFTNQTAVSLPASTANSLVKINYDCKCTVILEGIIDPSYVGPTPAPPETFFTLAGPVTVGTGQSQIIDVYAINYSSLVLSYYWSGGSTNSGKQGYIDYCAGSGCTNWTNLATYGVNSAGSWSGPITKNIPQDYDVIRIQYRANNVSNSSNYVRFSLKDITVTGVKLY